ncbi:hypothetical protein [Aulosira sp. FACHB-615]|uniref:hypothetical protein n=1 Tax=Aulosira sp. FACHB-615 TaxID=2692777 RepID=UPI001682390C|nr:hypothetical protein [Aulosira sp. FACHB-615]MBD2492411.1 hypothetical protein [Aulosira sp. FACHB-615]
MPTCEYCGIAFDLSDGIYDDGDFICGSCINIFIYKSETVQNNSKIELKPLASPHSVQVSEEERIKKLNTKADNLAKNIEIMVRGKTRSICINSSNKKAFDLAVERLGMKLDEFNIGDDDGYLQISLKRDI